MPRGTRNNLRLSRAHLDYLDHQESRPLGSGTPAQIRESVRRLLAGKLPQKKLRPQDQQSGREFVSYGLPRERIEFFLTIPETEKITQCQKRDGETFLEPLIRAHAERLGYRVVHHVCDKWCSPEVCPGRLRRAKTSFSS